MKARPPRSLAPELENFLAKLKEYKALLEKQLEGEERPWDRPGLSPSEEQQAQELHEWLVRKTGELKPLVEKYCGRRRIQTLDRVYDPWLGAFHKPVGFPRSRLLFVEGLVNIINESIGTINAWPKVGPSIYELTSPVYWAKVFAGKVRPLWEWAKVHRLKAVVSFLGGALGILGFLLKLFGVW